MIFLISPNVWIDSHDTLRWTERHPSFLVESLAVLAVWRVGLSSFLSEFWTAVQNSINLYLSDLSDNLPMSEKGDFPLFCLNSKQQFKRAFSDLSDNPPMSEEWDFPLFCLHSEQQFKRALSDICLIFLIISRCLKRGTFLFSVWILGSGSGLPSTPWADLSLSAVWTGQKVACNKICFLYVLGAKSPQKLQCFVKPAGEFIIVIFFGQIRTVVSK